MRNEFETRYDQMKRIVGVFLSMMMLAILLFSAIYLVEEWNHDCEGEDCPVCECIAQCQSYIRQLCDGTIVQGVCLLVVIWVLAQCLSVSADVVVPTLISWKVRLNP